MWESLSVSGIPKFIQHQNCDVALKWHGSLLGHRWQLEHCFHLPPLIPRCRTMIQMGMAGTVSTLKARPRKGLLGALEMNWVRKYKFKGK